MRDRIFTPSDRQAEDYLRAYVEFYCKKTVGHDTSSLDNKEKALLKQKAFADLLHELYKNLDTLDTKASGMLSFCGLIIAVLAIVITNALIVGDRVVVICCFLGVAAIVSSLFTMQLLFVNWSASELLAKRTLEDACKHYYCVREERTACLQWAWRFIFSATAVAVPFFAIDKFFQLAGL